MESGQDDSKALDEFTPEKIAWLREHACTAPMFFRALDGIEIRDARIRELEKQLTLLQAAIDDDNV